MGDCSFWLCILQTLFEFVFKYEYSNRCIIRPYYKSNNQYCSTKYILLSLKLITFAELVTLLLVIVK